MKPLDYKDSKFTVGSRWSDRFIIIGIESWSEEVWFPEDYRNSSITDLDLKHDEVQCHGVHILYIPYWSK